MKIDNLSLFVRLPVIVQNTNVGSQQQIWYEKSVSKSVSNSEISEISQDVVIIEHSESHSSNEGANIENIQFLYDNNDDLFLGASANSMCKLQMKEPLAGSLTRGYTAKQKHHTEIRGEGPTEQFKNKVVLDEKTHNRQ